MKSANKQVLKTVAAWWIFVMLPILAVGFFSGEPFLNFILARPAIGCIIIWVAFAILSGFMEAYYYVHEMHSSYQDNFNEHILFTLMRLCLLIPLGVILEDIILVVSLIAMFPFFHDGMYYTQRNKLDKTYPKRWFAQSKTSTAFLTNAMTPLIRTSFFIIGLIVYYYFSTYEN